MKYISERLNKLMIFDKIRLLKIAEMSQYAFFYVIIAFIIGYFVDKVFPKRDEESKTVTLVIETILQSMVAVVAIFYIRKCSYNSIAINFNIWTNKYIRLDNNVFRNISIVANINA